MYKTKKQKQKILDANKVVFQKGHPVWGIEGIPDPTWDDLKWFKSFKGKNKEKQQYDLYWSMQGLRLWQIAKIMDYRRENNWENTLHLNHYLTFSDSKLTVMNAPFATDQSADAQMIKAYEILLTEDYAPFRWGHDTFEKFANSGSKALIELFIERGLLSVEQQAAVYDTLQNKIRKKPKINELQSYLKGEPSQEKNHVWEKLSEKMIAHTVVMQDGSTLRRIFDFAAENIKTIERDASGRPATFENHFNEVSNDALQQAADILTAASGAPEFTAVRKAAQPIPKS